MADFIDERADEASDRDSDMESEVGRRGGANGRRNNRLQEDDSSEEEEDDDEEAQRQVAEGFIADEDEEDEEDDEDREARRRERKKRRREEREQEAVLDEEDLELIGVVPQVADADGAQPRFKRLKQGHRGHHTSALEFSDDEDRDAEMVAPPQDEFADFIEEDEFSDDDREKLSDLREVGRPGRKQFSVAGLTSGMDDRAMEDYTAAFGDGTEYEWALALEEQQEEEKMEEKPLELKDIFEPAQLAAKLLTDDDIAIRNIDLPERFQIAWKGFTPKERDEEELDELLQREAKWVAELLLPKKRLESYLVEPCKTAIINVLKFMTKEHFEVPFIFQHRRDFIIHDAQKGQNGGGGAERLLNQSDLWEIFELDLKFKSFLEKREATERTYAQLKEHTAVNDELVEDFLSQAVIADEIQDLSDYLHFRYSAEINDLQHLASTANGTHRRPRAGKAAWELLRASQAYNFVRALGMTTDDFARNTTGSGSRVFAEDSADKPDDLAESLIDDKRYKQGTDVIKGAKAIFMEELATNPRMRKFMRKSFYENGVIDCLRTKKGAVEITEDHRYYEFKYLRNLELVEVARKPETFLRMLKAEDEGLLEIKFRFVEQLRFREKLYKYIESDSFSEVADAWNALRREWIDSALDNLERIIVKGVKEAVKTECENNLARLCRDKYSEKLDLAPYKPQGMAIGTTPSVLALSNGMGVPGRDSIVWILMDENGRVVDNGKFDDIRNRQETSQGKIIPPGDDNSRFVDLVRRKRPDVIGISGFSPETRKLHKELQDILDQFEKDEKERRDRDRRPGESDDDEDDADFVKPDIVIVNDEVARLYYNNDKAVVQHPHLPPIARYCVALARYLRSPLLEYASLGQDILSIKFDNNQDLVPLDKLQRYLDSAIIDMVNLVGVDLEEAISDPYVANLLPYVCGLGLRKAARLLETVTANGGVVTSRKDLLGDSESRMAQATGTVVWYNCASFIYLQYQDDDLNSDPLDNTRIHPEDYDIALKIAADALNLDEEDIKDERASGAQSAEVRRLLAEKQEDALHDLALENYADELEEKLHQRKRATLETIRAELIFAYEELRHEFVPMNSEDIFTMLTGETKDSLADGMIVPVSIRKAFREHVEVRLDCGIEGGINQGDYGSAVDPEGRNVKDVYPVGATVPAKVLFLNRRNLVAQLSFREDMLKRPYARHVDRLPGSWDSAQEAADAKRAQQEKESKTGRPHRVVKHPLFKPFNSRQAEEYLGSRHPGDVVIRPSSRGLDHLAITWKVADNVYQHLDVLELDKENEYAVGKTLKIGKLTYSDLDDLIVNHIEAMAKKVTEMTNDDRFQKGSKSDTDAWLTTYTEANPRRSMYAFCINPKHPGYFNLCFKAGQQAAPGCWGVKAVPNGFELRNIQYPTMQALKNGFKLLMANDASKKR